MSDGRGIFERMTCCRFALADPPQMHLLEHILELYRFAALFVKGKKVLDIACGEGFGAALLREAGSAASVLGADVDEEVLAFARTEHAGEGLEYSVVGSGRLEESREFDVVVSINTIKHLPDPFRFLNLLKGYLAPGGQLFASVHVTPTTDFNETHFRDFSRGSFRRLLRKAGFQILSEFSKTRQYGAGKSLGLLKSKRADSEHRTGLAPLLGYYLIHPVKAMRRARSLLTDGMVVKDVVVRAGLPAQSS